MNNFILKTLKILLIVFGVTFFSGVCVIVVLFSELKASRPIINCDAFGSRKELMEALKTHKKLDRDKDGIPCNKQYNAKR